MSLERVQDYAGLSDHYVVVCCLAVTKRPPSTCLMMSKNIRAVWLSDFQADVKALVNSTGEQRSDLDLEDLVDAYDGLQRFSTTMPCLLPGMLETTPPLCGCIRRSRRHDDRGDKLNDDGERHTS